MTRSEKKNNTSNADDNVVTKTRVESSWILLAQDSLLQNSKFDIITLPHLANNKPTKYCLDQTNSKMYEIVNFSEPHRCWFMGQTLKSEASILMLTPINPIYLVLPLLREHCQNRAVPLEDLLTQKGLSKVMNYVADLDKVADLKGSEDLKAYKYNETKAVTWLENKVRKLAKVLREKNIHVRSGVASATFVASTASDDSIDEDFFLKYSLGIITEYLEDSMVELLEKKFNFKPDMMESLGQKRKSEAGEICNKRLKSENSEIKNILNSTSMPVLNKVNQQKPLTAKEKARQKAASGTKTISTFFTKK